MVAHPGSEDHTSIIPTPDASVMYGRNCMPNPKLPNYIRTHRKRACLTQGEGAFLLGSKSSAGISRHERFKQTPDLQTLLAYEMLFQTPVRHLFSSTREAVEQRLTHDNRL